jgi:hypothetical protein
MPAIRTMATAPFVVLKNGRDSVGVAAVVAGACAARTSFGASIVVALAAAASAMGVDLVARATLSAAQAGGAAIGAPNAKARAPIAVLVHGFRYVTLSPPLTPANRSMGADAMQTFKSNVCAGHSSALPP